MTEVDLTESHRRVEVARINSEAGPREVLEQKYGRVWSTDELTAEFDVIGFMAPYVVVKSKSDGKRGTLEFQHGPRFYFNWREN